MNDINFAEYSAQPFTSIPRIRGFIKVYEGIDFELETKQNNIFPKRIYCFFRVVQEFAKGRKSEY